MKEEKGENKKRESNVLSIYQGEYSIKEQSLYK